MYTTSAGDWDTRRGDHRFCLNTEHLVARHMQSSSSSESCQTSTRQTAADGSFSRRPTAREGLWRPGNRRQQATQAIVS